MPSRYVTLFLASWFLSALQVHAETHTVSFDNQCGHGTPQLIQNGNILSTGQPFTSNGPFSSAIAYLQTGNCLLNGEGCSLVETTLVNPTCNGCGSSTDISLIPPHAFSVPVQFSYSGGCNGQGATCTTADCKTAFFTPNDNQVQVECQANNVDLLITFCPGGSGGTPATPSSSSVNVPKPTSTVLQANANTSKAVPTPANTPIAVEPKPSSTPSATVASAQPSGSSAPKCRKRTQQRRALASQPVKSALAARVLHQHRRSVPRNW